MLLGSPLRFKRTWFVLGCLWVLLLVFMSLTDLRSVGVALPSDKLMHMLGYGFLMGWFVQIFHHPITRLLIAVVLAMMGVGVEYLQSMVPSRQFELADMLANTAGVLLAWALSYTFLGQLFIRFEKLISSKR